MSMYLDPNRALNRLRNEWDKHGRLIVAFDFDSTVVPYLKEEYKYDYEPIRQLLRDLKELDCVLICFTASDPERYPKIKELLNVIKVPYDYFNQTPEFIEKIGQNGKVYANVFIDDRAGLYETYAMLTQLVLERKVSNADQFMTAISKQMSKP